jgi:hypothetical protein
VAEALGLRPQEGVVLAGWEWAVVDANLPIRVRIVGVPTACAAGVTEPWRGIAALAASQLGTRFGDQISIEYYDLFSPEMDNFPEALALVQGGLAALPLVFVGDTLLSAGGKVSLPAIRQALEARGLEVRRAGPLAAVN